MSWVHLIFVLSQIQVEHKDHQAFLSLLETDAKNNNNQK